MSNGSRLPNLVKDLYKLPLSRNIFQIHVLSSYHANNPLRNRKLVRRDNISHSNCNAARNINVTRWLKTDPNNGSFLQLLY